MKYKLTYVLLLMAVCFYAQVGIGTTNPDASSVLDITSTDSGVLIPRMLESDKMNILNPAEGLLVYQTDNIEGFYYYDGVSWNYLATSGVNSWSRIGNSGTDPTADFLGTTDDTALVLRTNNVENIRVNSNNNVGIGTTLNTARLYTNIDVADVNTNYGIRNIHDGGSDDSKYGIFNRVSNDGIGRRYGIFSLVTQNPTSTELAYGTYNYLTSYGPANAYGLLNYHFAIGTGRNYGISNTLNLTTTTSDNVYLDYNFLNVSFSNNPATLYGGYYDIDFNAGTRYGTFKTMTSSSAYNGDMYGDYNQLLGDGDGIAYGSYNQLTGNGYSNKHGVYNEFLNGEGGKYGVYNSISNTNNGIVYGLTNDLENNSSTTPKYGVFNEYTNNDGTNFGVYNNLTQAAGSTRNVFGTFTTIPDVGMGTHYGAYFNVPGDGNYGIYSDNTSANGHAGYFDGRVEITGETLIDNNVLPVTDATHNLGSLTNRWNTIYATNGTIQTSDIRLKKKVQALDYGLDELMKIKPISYYWKEESPTETNKKIGLSAQNIQGVISEVVKEDKDSKVLGVNYAELVPVLIKAIQEQQEQIETLKKEVEELRNDKE